MRNRKFWRGVRFYFTCLTLVFTAAFSLAESKKEPVDWVDTRIGGVSHLLVPCKQTLQLPNSMMRSNPEKFDAAAIVLEGLPFFTHAHRWGSPLRFNVYCGERKDNWFIDNEKSTPYSYDVVLTDSNINVSYAVGEKAALYSLDFSKSSNLPKILEFSSKESIGDVSLKGDSLEFSYAIGRVKAYVRAEFSVLPEKIENAEKNFFPTFFDEEKGFYVMSVDSLSLVQRKTYALCAGYHWDSDYHFDLLGRFAKNCEKFVKENALSQSSLRNVPVWDDCFDADANQLNATFANVDEVLLRLAKFNDIEEVNQKWIEKLGYWMSKITCPEGESNLYESRTPIASRWDGENGSWQAFALKKWYCDIVEVLCGLSFDGGGITFERPCFEYKLRNLRYRDKTINISVSGAGREIENILVNGQTLKGTLKIPEEMLRNKNEIIVVLGEKQDFSILRGTGIGIYDYVYEDEKISFTAKGYGLKYLYFTDNAKVYINGKEIRLERLQEQGVAYIKMNLTNGQSVCIVKEKN